MKKHWKAVLAAGVVAMAGLGAMAQQPQQPDTGLGLGLQLRGAVCTRVRRTCRLGRQNRTDSRGWWNGTREFGRHTYQIAFGDAPQ